MISDYVMTEKNCRGHEVINDSVGLAAYNMDSHNCQRIVENGHAENEGDVQVPPMQPYPISYRSLVPKQSECENLFAPVCLAASHIAYGSIRMEPVFMILGQSSATAAALAIDEKIPAQKIDYAKLRARLLADKQVLDWPGGARAEIKPAVLQGIVLDDTEAQKFGEWVSSSAVTPKIGDSYIHDGNAHKGELKVVFWPEIVATGEYELFLISTANPNRATNVSVTVQVRGQSSVVQVNQRTGNGFASLGRFNLPIGRETNVTISNAHTDGFVVVDGLQLIRRGD